MRETDGNSLRKEWPQDPRMVLETRSVPYCCGGQRSAIAQKSCLEGYRVEKTLVGKNTDLSDPDAVRRIEQAVLDYLQKNPTTAMAPDDLIRAVRGQDAESSSSVRGAIWHLFRGHKIEFTEQFELTLSPAS